MPKERTHWLLARTTRDLLPMGDLKSLLEQEEAAYLIGAVAPDSLFMPVKLGKDFDSRRNFFHGIENNDTFSFWGRAYERGWLKTAWTKAFCYGLTSHILSDASYHPLVYYFCGWPEHPEKNAARNSMLRHFRLEALLDLYYQEQTDPSLELLFLDDMIEQTDLAALARTAAVLLTPDPSTPPDWLKKLFLSHGKNQRRFSAPGFKILSAVLKILGIGLDGKRDLIYRRPPGAFRSHRLEFRHPVTGEVRETNWEQMLESSSASAAEKFQQIEKTYQEADPGALVAGPHLESGLPSDDFSEKSWQFCDPQKPEHLFF